MTLEPLARTQVESLSSRIHALYRLPYDERRSPETLAKLTAILREAVELGVTSPMRVLLHRRAMFIHPDVPFTLEG